MPENKKNSFTFSDKIKNSKPAFNPFSKRASSKIGSNGKPKKTLFERTKRDAPFFVAAAAALLMLPFLYKYSGSVNEEPIVPPGSEDSIFDPERFGFEPSVEDPNGQIAQLAGRDPLSLIKGWGSNEDETGDEIPPYEPLNRDGLEDSGDDISYPSSDLSSGDLRRTVPPAVRGAFNRQSTKINEIGDASMARASGSGNGFRFGGSSLKSAAQQNSAAAPREGVKPVSLQPLRAADNPSRSYFGQGGAAQARASRDAMSKANAEQALRDAMFRPVETGRIGGLGGSEYIPGGGAGKMEYVMDYKGITPWWWDLMKQRSQQKWEWRYFLWRRNLIEPLIKGLAEVLVDFGKGLACCLLTGEDDCSMGSMWGVSGDSYSPAVCKCSGLGNFYSVEELHDALNPQSPMGKGAKFKDMCSDKNPKAKEYGCSYHEAKGGGGNLGFFGKRAYCLGNTIGNDKDRFAAAQLQDRFDCQALNTTHNFELQAKGKAGGWNKYHLVVAKNYAPFENGKNLCDAPLINYNKQSGSGVGNNEAKRGARATNEKQIASRSSMAQDELGMGLVKENMNDGCVIYVAEGEVFNWDNFQVQVKTLLTQLYPDKTQAEYDKAFANMRLYFIEGLALKQKLSRGAVKVGGVKVKGMPVDRLPMTYVDFETNFILRRGNSSKETTKFRDKERKFAQTYTGVDGSSRTQLTDGGKETAIRTSCYFSDFQIKAVTIEDPSKLESVLTFNPSVYGSDAKDITITMDVYDLNNRKLFSRQIESSQRKVTGPGVLGVTYVPTAQDQKAMQGVDEIDVRWTASVGEKTSEDNTGYVAVMPEVKPVIEKGGTEVKKVDATGEAEATTFAYLLRHIPQNPSERKPLQVASLTIAATDATVAEASEEARKKATQEVLANIENGGNILNGNALYSDMAIVDCFPDGGDNIVIQSDQAQAFMKQIEEAYNKKYPDNPIVYKRTYPSIANLADALHIATAEGFSQQAPKAAACQLGRIVSTIGKDRTIVSAYNGIPNVNLNNEGKEYNNTFGAFATYIGLESARFPADTSTDSSFSTTRNGVGLNPRFWGYNPKLTSYRYHFGNYVNNGKISSTFQSDLKARQAKAGGGDIFPLKELSLVSDVSWQVGGKDPDANNRKKYWQAYSPMFQSERGCDNTYGSDTMSAKEVLRYLEMVCRVGLSDKPRSGMSDTRTSTKQATGLGSATVGQGHSTSTSQASK